MMDYVLASRTVNRYCCSKCWGHLTSYHAETGYTVQCDDCGPGQGFVTKHYVEQERQKDMTVSGDTKRMLQDIGIIENPHKDKPVKDLLKELGF